MRLIEAENNANSGMSNDIKLDRKTAKVGCPDWGGVQIALRDLTSSILIGIESEMLDGKENETSGSERSALIHSAIDMFCSVHE